MPARWVMCGEKRPDEAERKPCPLPRVSAGDLDHLRAASTAHGRGAARRRGRSPDPDRPGTRPAAVTAGTTPGTTAGTTVGTTAGTGTRKAGWRSRDRRGGPPSVWSRRAPAESTARPEAVPPPADPDRPEGSAH